MKKILFAVLTVLTVLIVSLATYLFVQKSPSDEQVQEDSGTAVLNEDNEHAQPLLTTVAPIEQKNLFLQMFVRKLFQQFSVKIIQTL